MRNEASAARPEPLRERCVGDVLEERAAAPRVHNDLALITRRRRHFIRNQLENLETEQSSCSKHLELLQWLHVSYDGLCVPLARARRARHHSILPNDQNQRPLSRYSSMCAARFSDQPEGLERVKTVYVVFARSLTRPSVGIFTGPAHSRSLQRENRSACAARSVRSDGPIVILYTR